MLSLFSRLELQRNADEEVSKVAFIDKGYILVGRRTDDNQFDLPGGRLEREETPQEAAVRETFEETGIRVPKLKWLVTEVVESKSGNKLIHGFVFEPGGRVKPQDTEEMHEWKWVPMNKKEEVFNEKNWHNVDDVVLDKLGLR